MKGRLFGFLALLVCFAVTAAAQMPSALVDIYAVKVKPEKRFEFDNLVKKMADAQRRNNGDTWITSETVSGEHNNVFFWSIRAKYAGIDEGMKQFEAAVGKAFGPAAGKLFADFANCISAGRGEIRRTRPELSYNAPKDQPGINRLVGEARVYRSTSVRIRPGWLSDYEDQLRKTSAALAKADAPGTTLVSQSNAGQQGTVFYFTQLYTSWAAMDTPLVGLRKALGESGYRDYQNLSRNAVISTETIINKMVPELSNPPREIVEIAPDFWAPKPKTVPASKKAEKQAD